MWWNNKQAGETYTSSLIDILLRFHVPPGIYLFTSRHFIILLFIHLSMRSFLYSSPFILALYFIICLLHVSSTFLLFYVEMAFPWLELTCVNRELFSIAKLKVLPTSPSCTAPTLSLLSFSSLPASLSSSLTICSPLLSD